MEGVSRGRWEQASRERLGVACRRSTGLPPVSHTATVVCVCVRACMRTQYCHYRGPCHYLHLHCRRSFANRVRVRVWPPVDRLALGPSVSTPAKLEHRGGK